MDKQTEALKLALEALEYTGLLKSKQAITAILEALAEQPAQQQEQEPVAWMCTETKILYDHDTSEVDKYHGFKPTMPLYAHPAPQPSKPLTDAQIGAVAADIWGSILIAPQSYQAFARAIEAAHGITGETK